MSGNNVRNTEYDDTYWYEAVRNLLGSRYKDAEAVDLEVGIEMIIDQLPQEHQRKVFLSVLDRLAIDLEDHGMGMIKAPRASFNTENDSFGIGKIVAPGATSHTILGEDHLLN